jgi:hypothetical protein
MPPWLRADTPRLFTSNFGGAAYDAECHAVEAPAVFSWDKKGKPRQGARARGFYTFPNRFTSRSSNRRRRN